MAQRPVFIRRPSRTSPPAWPRLMTRPNAAIIRRRSRSGDRSHSQVSHGPRTMWAACFTEGLGIDRDPALALRWLTLAAEAGDPVGRRNLAALYFKGEGVAQDHARAT